MARSIDGLPRPNSVASNLVAHIAAVACVIDTGAPRLDILAVTPLAPMPVISLSEAEKRSRKAPAIIPKSRELSVLYSTDS